MAHDNAPLSAGTQVRAVDFPPSVSVRSDTVITGVTSTSYTTGTPEVAARFQAPTSGRVAVTVSGGVRNDSAASPADRLFLTFQLSLGDPGDGNIIQAEEVNYGVSTPGFPDATDDYSYNGHLTIVHGLTPGAFYYARLRHRVTIGSGTADIAFRSITVFPIP